MPVISCQQLMAMILLHAPPFVQQNNSAHLTTVVLSIAKALVYVSYFSVLVPLFALIAKRNFWADTLMKLLCSLVLISAFSDIISYILSKFSISNLQVGNLYCLLSFIVISLIYRQFLKESRTMIAIITILFVVFFGIDSFFLQKITTFQSYTRILASIICIGYAVLFYNRSNKTSPVNDPVRDSPFWINTAFWYYFTVNVFLFCASSFIFNEAPTNIAMVFWGFHNFNNIVRNLLLTLGIYLYQRERPKNFDLY